MLINCMSENLAVDEEQTENRGDVYALHRDTKWFSAGIQR